MTRYLAHAIIADWLLAADELWLWCGLRETEDEMNAEKRPLGLLGAVLALGFLVPLFPRQAQTAPTPTTATQPPATPYIASPVSGQNLQGAVGIIGSTVADGFISYTLEFGYLDDPSRTWFEITSARQSIANDVLGVWETQGLTDGNYRLRLRVFTISGEPRRFVLEDVRIRNYTPTDTATPTLKLEPTQPSSPTMTPTPSATDTLAPTETAPPLPTPTLLPPNPVEVSSSQIRSSALRGAAAAVILFAVFGLALRLRRS